MQTQKRCLEQAKEKQHFKLLFFKEVNREEKNSLFPLVAGNTVLSFFNKGLDSLKMFLVCSFVRLLH